MDKWEAQYKFWSGFGVPAYEQNSVPDADHVIFPYITYQAVSSGFGDEVYPTASIWTRSKSWLAADTLSDAIENKLKDGGTVIPYDNGILWITTLSPFSESIGDPNDDLVKRKILAIKAQFI